MATTKPKILLIEDDDDQLMMYEVSLAKAGFSVSKAHNGKQGIIMALKNKPDLIMLDLVLPDMPGQEILSELKKLQAAKDIKVVVLSNLNKKEVIEECFRLGAADFLIKMQFLPREVAAKALGYLKN
ncbi:response regulator [Candidatus Falkowbacteria bacterium]|nr:response regulator [Candidatus Falkowbacteria bacterium]